MTPLEAQVREAIAILRDGTDYERLHVVAILEDGLAASAPAGEVDAEYELRKHWWLGHGHTQVYGDDGEMQCYECMPFGMWDWRREPLEKCRATFHAVLASRSAAPAGEREAVLCAECGHPGDWHTGSFTACNHPEYGCSCNGWNPASPSPGAAREEERR